MRGRPAEKALLIISFILICAGFVSAQTYSGTVRSQSGSSAPVEGVFVSVGYTEFYTWTDAQGRFEINSAPISVGYTGPQRSKGQPINARWNFRRRTLDLSGAPVVTSASVYSLNGRRLVNSKVPPSGIIELPSLPVGIYLLELKGEGGVRSTGRVVLSNKNSSFTFRSMSSSGGSLLSASESAQTSSTAAQRLIFRHDKYFPVDMEVSGSQSGMFVLLTEDPRNVVFDQTKVHEYRFTISSADSLHMHNLGWDKAYKPAAMEYNGASIGGMVGLRYKGSNYSLPRCFNFDGRFARGPKTCDKISFKVKFTEYDKDKRFHAMKRINLHSMNSDPTKMRDMLAYELFREVGIHAPRTSYANVYVNGTHIGFFVAVEQIDGRFTKSRWPEHGDGNLYKEIWPDVSFQNKGTEEYYIEALKTNDKPENNPQARRMVDFYNAIAASNEQNFVQNLSPFMDFDHFLRYMAVDVAINNWDGIRGWYSNGPLDRWPWSNNHNFYFYEEENPGGKIWLVPWDMDNTFYEVCNYFDQSTWGVPEWNIVPPNCAGVFVGESHIRPPNCDKLTGMMAKLFWDRYRQFGEQFLKDQFRSERLAAKVDRHRQLISAHVAADNAIQKEWYNWEDQVNRKRGFMPNLATKFSRHLRGDFTPPVLPPNPNSTHLSRMYSNDFELTAADSLSRWITMYSSDNTTTSFALNTSSPIDGNADLRFDFTLRATGNNVGWDVWTLFQPAFERPANLSNLREIRINMRADRSRSIRIALGNWEVYTENGTVSGRSEYGWEGIQVNAQAREIVLDVLNLRYPVWGGPDPNIKVEVLRSVRTLMFAINGRYSDDSGLVLIDNDTGHLQVDNIRFIYSD